MENIWDLLAPRAGEEEAARERLDIKRGPHGLYIPGLTEHQVTLPVPDQKKALGLGHPVALSIMSHVCAMVAQADDRISLLGICPALVQAVLCSHASISGRANMSIIESKKFESLP